MLIAARIAWQAATLAGLAGWTNAPF